MRAAWFLVTLIACSGTTIVSGPARPPAPDATVETVKLCASACAKRSQCAKESDEAVCNDQCASRLGRKIETLRREVVEDLIACLDKSSCADLKSCRFEVQDRANDRKTEREKEIDEDQNQNRSGRDGG